MQPVKKIAFALLLFLIVYICIPSQSFAAEWKYEIEPYLQFTSIDGDASLGRVTGAAVDVGFDDILEKLELAGMVHFEAHNNNGWGISLDYGFMNLGSDISGPLGGVAKVDVRQGVLEALAVRRNTMADGQLDYLFGIRWWDNDLDVTVDTAVFPGSTTAGVVEDWIDLVVGARWRSDISKKWKLHLRGDIGGLGMQSDYTSTFAIGALYQISKEWILDLKYKATKVDYENDKAKGQPGYFSYNTVTHGPLVGIVYKY